jgi:predicted GNAT family acetyltransferase
MASEVTVKMSKNPQLGRYEARIGDKVAGFAVFQIQGDRVIFQHTIVADEFEGQGIGSQLAKFALDDVRSSGRLISPICPFISAYISRHPEYVRFVDSAYKRQFS